MSPLIALAGRYGAPSRVSRDAVAFAGRRYLDAILRAGGEPVVISPQPLMVEDARAMMQRFDGLVLMGGADVNPALYGQTAGIHIYGVQPEQDAFESALLNASLNADIPVLAICRGMQLANVVRWFSILANLLMRANFSITHQNSFRLVKSLRYTELTLSQIRRWRQRSVRHKSTVHHFITKVSTVWRVI